MKNAKKLTALLLSLALVFALAACGGNPGGGATSTPAPVDQNTPAPATQTPDDQTPANTEFRVAMITDYGDITDESFNQTTYEACKAFCDANGVDFTYKKPAGDSTPDRVAMVDVAVAEDYNVIVMPGFAFGATIIEVAELYPDVKFIALDVAAGDILEAGVAKAGETYDYNPENWDVTEYYHAENVYCAVYQEELSGYMAGYAAVKLGYKHLGFLGGMSVPAVVRYGYGFVQGADAAAAEMGITGDVTIEYVYGNQFSGDADITAYMDTWYSNGVEVVFAAGGSIYTSACEAAAKTDGKLIGVDVDQAAIINAYGEGMTVTSAMKGLEPTVLATLDDVINNGNWADYSGKIETLGLVSGDDPSLNYVQLPESTQWSDSFGEADYQALVKGMYDGTIKVSNDVTAEPAVTITVNYLGTIK